MLWAHGQIVKVLKIVSQRARMFLFPMGGDALVVLRMTYLHDVLWYCFGFGENLDFEFPDVYVIPTSLS